MANLNKVLLIGRLTRDPEILWTTKGTAVCKAGLAVNRTWRSQDGTKQEETCFVDITLFGKRGETFHQYMRKGRPVFVEGRLNFDSWEGKDGQRRSKLNVVVDNFQFLGGRNDNFDDQRGGSAPAPARRSYSPQPAAHSAGPPRSGGGGGGGGGGWHSGPPQGQPEPYQESYDDLGDDNIPF